MRRLGIIAPLLAALLTPSAAIAQAPAASGVTVYRCTDSKGQLVALRPTLGLLVELRVGVGRPRGRLRTLPLLHYPPCTIS